MEILTLNGDDVQPLAETIDEAVADILRDHAEAIDPVRSSSEDDPMWGYGSAHHSHGANGTLEMMMAPFCWCDHEDCPFCTHELGGERHTAHKAVRLLSDWQKVHHVHGEGAPNFYFRDADGEVFLWWYKHLGRSLRAMTRGAILETPEDAARLADRLARARQALQRDIVADSLARGLNDGRIDTVEADDLSVFLPELVKTAPVEDLPELAVRLGRILRRARIARVDAIEIAEIEAVLDEGGIRSAMNPEDPPEYQLRFTASRRVASVIFPDRVLVDPFACEDEVPFETEGRREEVDEVDF